ncbi:hypothetical protein CCR75_000171 [Bremia lactucae]|uniref:Uncharacterized protein n=1 Tax=Bremia lactucae TaxID=4779 RepID=A0A976FPK3_BRELC|nr:hypothetical protein CCR75_000171 [Bremia lactucae]
MQLYILNLFAERKRVQCTGCYRNQIWTNRLIEALAIKCPNTLFDSLSKLMYALLTTFTGNKRIQ